MKNLALTLLLAFSFSFASAQNKPATPKPVVYTVSIGGYKDANIPAEQFKRIADSAITVRDEKGNAYPVVRFRINYTFTTTYTDSETQQLKNFKDFRAADFYDTNKLSEVWASSIMDNAKKDDEVIINNVIVKLKNGKKVMVPDWRGTLR